MKRIVSIIVVFVLMLTVCMVSALAEPITEKLPPVLQKQLETLDDNDMLVVDVYVNTHDQYQRYAYSQTIIEKLGVSEKNVIFIGQFDSYTTLKLTKAQIISATLLDEVQWIEGSYEAPVEDNPTDAANNEKLSPVLQKRLETLDDNDMLLVDVYVNTHDQYQRYAYSQTIIEKLGVSEKNVIFIGQFDSYTTLKLTKVQIISATLLDEVQRIEISSEAPVEDNPTGPPTTVPGDADKDGSLTILDATHIQRYLAGLIDESEIDLAFADYDEDGDVTILDATAIQRTLVGLTTEA